MRLNQDLVAQEDSTSATPGTATPPSSSDSEEGGAPRHSSHLAPEKPQQPAAADSGEAKSSMGFRRALLDECQRAFERDLSTEAHANLFRFRMSPRADGDDPGSPVKGPGAD